METNHDDCFALFIQNDDQAESPAGAECELVHCATYEEARRLRSALQSCNRDIVIRYVGQAAGGGD